MGNLLLKANNLLEDLGQKIGSFLDTKDSILENDYIEVLGDSFKVVGLLRKANEIAIKKRFETFLDGFNSIDNPTEEQLAKLIKYIDNEQKAEFIADTFQKILLAKSSKSCLIMGTIMQDIIESKDELTLEDLVCLDSLTNFFDFDIVHYKYICDYAIEEKNRASRGRAPWLPQTRPNLSFNRKFNDKCKNDRINVHSVSLTVEKAVAHQLLEKEIEVDLDIDSDDVGSSGAENHVYFILTAPGNKLYEYILRISKNEGPVNS